jgi:hypothetical protein
MPSDGYDSYFIIGIQDTDWDTPVLTASMKQIIYEMVSETLRNVTTPRVPERLQGNPSPIRQGDNFIHAAGDINMQLHVDNLFELLAQLFHATDSETSSTNFVKQEVYGNGAGAGKAFSSPLSLDTQPTATDPASDPGRLIFTLDQADSGTFAIAGTDQNDAAITENLVFDASATETTTKHFKTVDAGGITWAAGFTTATTLLIESDKDTYTHVIELGDSVRDGLTIEMVKGGIPSVYIGALVNSATMTLGEDLSLAMSLLAKRGWNRCKVPASGTTPTSSTTPTDISGYTRIAEQVFPGWGLAMYLDGAGSATEVNGLTLMLNNNLDFPTRYRNVRTRPKPVRTARRETAITVGIDYDTVNADMDVKALNNQVMQVQVVAYCKPYAGAEYSIQWDMPRCQITAFPDPEVSDFSEVIQELALNPIKSDSASSSDEMKVTLVNKEEGKPAE